MLSILSMKICAIFTVFSIMLFVCVPVGADNFPAAPPFDTVSKETEIAFSLSTPSNKVHINVTEYDARQIVRNITLEFVEPITYVSFLIDILKDKPFVANAVNAIPIQYYSIRFNTDLIDKIKDITIIFAIQTNVSLSKNVEPSSLSQYQYDGNQFEVCPTEKMSQDDTFSYYQTETKPSSYYAIAGKAAFTVSWFFLLVLSAVVVATGLYIFRRYKLTHMWNKVKA